LPSIAVHQDCPVVFVALPERSRHRSGTVGQLPHGNDWLYELKFDGYRASLMKDGADLEIRSRNDKNLTAMYPHIAAAGAEAA
jgi:ATP-dependent DNA ligase